MKIVSGTHTKLTLKNSPKIVALSICATTTFVLAGFIVVICGELSNLSCNRLEASQGMCQLVRSNLLGRQNIRIPLNKFHGAKVEKNSGEDSDTYRVVIHTNNGEEPLTRQSDSDFDEKQAIVVEINNFIKNPRQKSLVVEQDTRLSMYLVGGLIAACGFLVIILGATFITYTFDKTLNHFILKRQSLFGTKIIQHQIQEIKDVELKYDSENSGSLISLILVSGDRVPFTRWYTNEGNEEEAVLSIRKFLNIN
jgi:hypothetical protein